MKTLLLFALLPVLAFGLRAADAPSPIEVAYWNSLNDELATLRTANRAAGIRALYGPLKAEQIAPVARALEDFLDRRDQDPVDELGPDMLAYREQLIGLIDLALVPVIGAQRYHSTLITNGMERMSAVLRIRRELKEVDDHKPRLAALHQDINQRIVAAGGQARPFFQVLGLGDEPRTAGDLINPEERHQRFIAESRQIHDSLGLLTEHVVVALVRNQGISPENAMAAMDDAIQRMATTIGNASAADIRGALAGRKPFNDDGTPSQPFHLLTLGLLERENKVAHQLVMQEWRGAFHRWTGATDNFRPLAVAGDVAVDPRGQWFAHAVDAHSLVIRNLSGTVLNSHRFDEELRAFAANTNGDIDILTTRRPYRIVMGGPTPQILSFDDRPNRFVQPHIAGAAHYDRAVFAFGVMPGTYTGTIQNTFAASRPGSRISAVGISGDGRRVTYGYAGDQYLPGGNVEYGFYQLLFEQGPIDTASEIVARHGSMLVRGAVTALSLNDTGDRVASTLEGRFGGLVTYHEFTDDSVERKILAADGQAYHWVHLIDGDQPRVIAGTRQGVVRAWDVNSGQLLMRFEVPTGPEGVGLAVIGDALVSTALGDAAIHLWNLADGSLRATLDGNAPAIDEALLAARLDEERGWRAQVHDKFVRLWELPSDAPARAALFAELRGPLKDTAAALGVLGTVNHGYARDRYLAVKALYDQKRHAEGFAMGRKDIDEGLLDAAHFELTLNCGADDLMYGNRKDTAAAYPPLIEFAERGTTLFDGNVYINTTLHQLRAYHFLAQTKVREALAEVDQMDQWSPSQAPRPQTRAYILNVAGNRLSGTNRRLAADYFVEAVKWESDKTRQLGLAEGAFALAVQAQYWPKALDAANIILSLNPAKQNDANFMHWARTAYQNVNPR
jgi:hypothetical protein